MSRIILLGATGYTGSLVLDRLAAQPEHEVILAGRDPSRLRARAQRSGLACGIAGADITAPGALDSLLDAEDVLISTVGPFLRLGTEVARSAARAGAVYLDSTGEPPFIEWMFRTLNRPAADSGALLIPAFGYDFVPGHLAAALALNQAGQSAHAVEIGYFLAPGAPGTPGIDRVPTLRQTISMTTPGTRASLVGVITESSFGYRAVASDPFGMARTHNGERLLRFSIAGTPRTAVSMGGGEHYGLPDAYPQLRRVDVGLGWFGQLTPALRLVAHHARPVLRTTAINHAAEWIAGNLPWQHRLPDLDGRTVVAATARAQDDSEPTTVVVEGPEPYALTAELLASAATHFAAAPHSAVGVHGPITALGTHHFHTLTRAAGLVRTDAATGNRAGQRPDHERAGERASAGRPPLPH
ncbi:saccharopine dehydrogenase NADP-binding domain-containing protein [Nocardia sp. NPDC003693]